ncbi:DUF429 domain-containing protein [Haloquadratum walsbyi]|jgi:hypothetical protein|uniref:DUF429 domain-containing protein n=1 Tax=Haloquadratum walsbyi TaxID=293091 RepID=UPI0015F48430|nr:DUF429 domain-containing protein [Haloquadratum walsbyi]
MLAHTIYGVDFSGAARAGDNIYLARGRVPTTSSDETLHIETCTPAPTLLDTTADRDAVLSGLREFIATRPTSDTGSVAFGCDFAFSIPMVHIAAVDDVTDWQSFLQWFPGDMTDPSTFASWAGDIAAATETKRTYIQRLTDTRVGALSPYHFFIQSQTFYGIRDVLAPLVKTNSIRVRPMQSPTSDIPWVVEAYPAATLDRFGLPDDGYKSTSDDAYNRRQMIIEEIDARDDVTLTPEAKTTALTDPDGDALDAVIAAVATFHVARDGITIPSSADDRWQCEGWIVS